jgi:multiple sugar transport system ATP-binding protein
MAEIELRHIEKGYGQTAVVKGVSLGIRDGEFLTLVGPSGCGKSTLLRIIAGLEAQDGGEVIVGGRCVNDKRPKERDVAMVFQSYALYPHLSVFDKLALPLRTRRLSFAQRLPFVGRVVPGRDGSAPRLPRQLPYSISSICCTASRASFPAASASASRWAARWCGTPQCS